MQQAIHPEYHQAEVTCTCGNTFLVGSTLKEIHVEICNACHPVFSGSASRRLIDTEGRVERFNRRFSKAAQKAK
jgi:large subunit ribosomal protein L31